MVLVCQQARSFSTSVVFLRFEQDAMFSSGVSNSQWRSPLALILGTDYKLQKSVKSFHTADIFTIHLLLLKLFEHVCDDEPENQREPFSFLSALKWFQLWISVRISLYIHIQYGFKSEVFLQSCRNGQHLICSMFMELKQYNLPLFIYRNSIPRYQKWFYPVFCCCRVIFFLC